MGGFFTWSKTASSNATADNTIGWSEGQAPSSVNDSARAMMARTAEWRDDISGTITTGGTSTAYTVTSNQVFDTLAHMNGAMIAFVPHATNGATVTLAVDGLTAKPLRYGPSLELQTGVLIQGTPYVCSYNNSDGAFYLQGGFANPYGIPLGGMMPYIGSTAPNSAFVVPIGQAISRTTYATLFTLVTTLYGAGDGSTTFNVPDLRGRTVFQPDSGGSGRITVAGGNFDGTVISGTGGAQNHTMTSAELAAHTHGSGSLASANPTAGGQNALAIPNGSGSQLVSNSSTTVNIFNTATYAQVIAGAISGSTGSTGSATPFTIMPPTILLPFILRVI